MNLSQHTWHHIRRSPYQALAAIAIMTLTLFITSLFLFITFGMQKALDFVEGQPQLIIFFQDEATQKQIDELKEKLNATGKVASQKYISKEEALQIYREQNKDDPLLLELVTANILPASLEISATNARYLAEFNDILKDHPAIEEIVYQKDLTDTLIAYANVIRRSVAILIVFSIVITLLIILLVIGVKISSRKEEIAILKLVGASHWYIGRPFILEGAIYGFLGAILAWGLSYLFVYQFLISLEAIPAPLALFRLTDFLPLNQPLFLLKVLGGISAGGFSIGVLGSSLAVWRYL